MFRSALIYEVAADRNVASVVHVGGMVVSGSSCDLQPIKRVQKLRYSNHLCGWYCHFLKTIRSILQLTFCFLVAEIVTSCGTWLAAILAFSPIFILRLEIKKILLGSGNSPVCSQKFQERIAPKSTKKSTDGLGFHIDVDIRFIGSK